MRQLLLGLVFSFSMICLGGHSDTLDAATIAGDIRHFHNLKDATPIEVQFLVPGRPYPKQRIIANGSTIFQEREDAPLPSGEMGYSRVVQEFSQMGYRMYRQGFPTNEVANEGELDKFQPSIGIGLFASALHLSELISHMEDAKVENGMRSGESVLMIDGIARALQTVFEIKLVIRKKDYLLLEQTTSPRGSKTALKQVADILVSTDRWPYGRIYSEVWTDGNLQSRQELEIKTTTNFVNQATTVVIPKGTIVTDTRFTNAVVYVYGVDKFTDEEIALMSTDFDYRTNKYYMTSQKIIKPIPSSNGLLARYSIIAILSSVSIGFLFAMIFKARSARNN